VASPSNIRASGTLRSTNGVNLVEGYVGTISHGLIECDAKRRAILVVNNWSSRSRATLREAKTRSAIIFGRFSKMETG